MGLKIGSRKKPSPSWNHLTFFGWRICRTVISLHLTSRLSELRVSWHIYRVRYQLCKILTILVYFKSNLSWNKRNDIVKKHLKTQKHGPGQNGKMTVNYKPIEK